MLDPAPEPPSFPPSPPGDSEVAPVRRQTLPVERLGALIEVFSVPGFPHPAAGLCRTVAGRPAGPRPGRRPVARVRRRVGPQRIWCLCSGSSTFSWARMASRFASSSPGGRRPAREIALGVLLIPAAFAVVLLVLAIVLVLRPSLNNVPVNPFERMMQTPKDAAVFALVVMLAGGVREEVQRGFIVRRFDQYLGGGLVGVAIYTVVFGLGHIEQGYAAAIATGGLGALWGWVYYVRRSIIAPMISHAGFNLGQLVKYVSLG